MKIASIVAEYNPFHNGHKYQIEKIKNEYTDYIIVIMSTSFVQRGEPAIIDKFTRAKIAIDNGASLVIENPVIYSTANAELFSKGAINILNSFQSIDKLFFGSENELKELINIKEKIDSNFDDKKIKTFIDDGYSYIKSKELAMDFLSAYEKNIYKKPNNILAFEYLNALEKLKSKITPHSIIRKSVNHDSFYPSDNFASASLIRNLIKNKTDYTKYTPNYNIYDIHLLDDYFDIIKYKILTQNCNFENYFDYEVGLENRMFNNLDSKDAEEFIERTHSKRHSKSRIKRLLIQILLDLDKNLILESFNFPYIRVLGLDDRGAEILNTSNNKNIISSFKKYYDSSIGIQKQILDKEILATNLYNYKSGNMGLDFTHKIYKKT